MSTLGHINEQSNRKLRDASGLKIAVIVSAWNSEITYALRDGALDYLQLCKAEEVSCFEVPGAFELTNAAARVRRHGRYDAVIVIGCVIRGDTPHFDYVCQGVTQGITYLNATPNGGSSVRSENVTPVIFCVLTTDNLEQATARAGGYLGNKGEEAAECAIEMATLDI